MKKKRPQMWSISLIFQRNYFVSSGVGSGSSSPANFFSNLAFASSLFFAKTVVTLTMMKSVIAMMMKGVTIDRS